MMQLQHEKATTIHQKRGNGKVSSLVCIPTLLLVQMINEWDISNSRWEISREEWKN
jgi:hypothetical protein